MADASVDENKSMESQNAKARFGGLSLEQLLALQDLRPVTSHEPSRTGSIIIRETEGD